MLNFMTNVGMLTMINIQKSDNLISLFNRFLEPLVIKYKLEIQTVCTINKF